MVFEGIDLGNYRKKIEIIADILDVVGQGATKTKVMYHANLSYKLLVKYLNNVTAAKLVIFEKRLQCYLLTPKGEEFLTKYKEYAKHNRHVEERLNHLNDQRTFLEETFLRSRNGRRRKEIEAI
jgi:predicted transcriptional regulator